jgi:hypothetical protein
MPAPPWLARFNLHVTNRILGPLAGRLPQVFHATLYILFPDSKPRCLTLEGHTSLGFEPTGVCTRSHDKLTYAGPATG